MDVTCKGDPFFKWGIGQNTLVYWLSIVLAPLVFILMTVRCHRPTESAPQNHSGKNNAGEMSDVVLASPGRIEGITDTINVNAGTDGVLASLRVREGQKVAAGDVVAIIGCNDLAAELAAARAAVESTRHARTRLLRGARKEERQRAAAERTAAEAVLKQTQLHHQRMAQLFERGAISKDAMEEVQRNFEVAESTLAAAMISEELTNAPPLPEELAKADAEVRAAEERVKTAAAKLEKCSVKAPISGTVVRCYLKAGESVSTTFPQPIISLADTSRLRVRAEVDERDVGRIYLNQRAIVLADAFPEQRFMARVSRLSVLMGRKKVHTGDPAEKNDRDVLEVIADLEQTDKLLVLGLRVTVQFLGSDVLSPVSNQHPVQ